MKCFHFPEQRASATRAMQIAAGIQVNGQLECRARCPARTASRSAHWAPGAFGKQPGLTQGAQDARSTQGRRSARGTQATVCTPCTHLAHSVCRTHGSTPAARPHAPRFLCARKPGQLQEQQGTSRGSSLSTTVTRQENKESSTRKRGVSTSTAKQKSEGNSSLCQRQAG